MPETETHQPWTYTRKTPAEIEQLAWDVVGNQVFGTWSVREGEDPILPFLILRLLSPEQRQDLARNKIVHVYEYLNRASPRSVNGMPSFLSCQYIDEHDARELGRRVDELRRLMTLRMSL